MTKEEYISQLQSYVPEGTAEWVYEFMTEYKVRFRIARHRDSKFGDYQWPRAGHPYHEISVNGDLNPYRFYKVLLHEAAHLLTFNQYGRVQPHGREWQQKYAELLLAHVEVFPEEVRGILVKYASRIPLSNALKHSFEDALYRYDLEGEKDPALTLNELPAGTCFCLKQQLYRRFRSIEKRRTRWRCVDLDSGGEYLVAGRCEVEVIEDV